MTTYFTPSVFSAIRKEIGTLGAIQQMFQALHVEDDVALDLLFSIADLATLREMEGKDDTFVFFTIDGLASGYKDALAMKQEMEVTK